MVGTIRMDKGGQRVEYIEKVYRGGKLEVTIASVCRPIQRMAAPQTLPPAEKSQPPVLPEPQRQTWPLPDSFEAICLESSSANGLSACTRHVS